MHNVKLQFPNVRLSLYNQLLDSKSDCAAVMFACAYELGLLPDGSLAGLEPPAGGETCGAIWAARRIVEEYFRTRDDESLPAQTADQVWSRVDKDVVAYIRGSRLKHAHKKNGDAKECGLVVPFVFDILLQHLRRYS